MQDIQTQSMPGSDIESQTAEKKDIVWLVTRVFNSERQNVPGWGGFISETEKKPEILTSIYYY